MSNTALANLAQIGQLKVEPPAKAEFEGLLVSGQRRLQDAEIATLKLFIEGRGAAGKNDWLNRQTSAAWKAWSRPLA